ncbi:MAG: PH domain-containing protein [Phycisphaerae bacterium]|nr:PH domain-containing protein [Phycisphaerae bacterium]
MTDMLRQNLINDDEIIIFVIKPSLWTIVFLSFRAIIVGFCIATLAHYFADNLKLQEYRKLVIAGCVIGVSVRIFIAILQWIMRSYILTDKRIITVYGVLTVRIFQCRHDKIQNTFVQMSLMQRILGIGSIGFATAGTGYIESVWQDINNPEQVQKQITATLSK